MIASLLLTFRESLEAAFIVGIMAAYLTKTGKKEALKYVYFGAVMAIIASFGIGLLVFLLFGSLEGRVEDFFEGMAALFAASILTYVIVWMTHGAKTIRFELQKKVDSSLSGGGMAGVIGASFFAIFREGVETILFLSAIFPDDPAGTLVGAMLGILSVVVLTLLAFRGIVKMDLKKFFTLTSFILILFSAGLVASGTHGLIEAGLVPPGKEEVWDINPPQNLDGSYPLMHEEGLVGSLLKSLFGYNGNPDLTEIVAYFLYWIIVGGYFLKANRSREV